MKGLGLSRVLQQHEEDFITRLTREQPIRERKSVCYELPKLIGCYRRLYETPSLTYHFSNLNKFICKLVAVGRSCNHVSANFQPLNSSFQNPLRNNVSFHPM